MFKIKEVYGFNLSYDERKRQFIITDTDGTEMGVARNQDEAEQKAKTLSKSEFKRINIFCVKSDGRVMMGELTSFNPDDKSSWVSMEKSVHTYGSGRSKIDLNYDKGYYEASDSNLKIVEAITAKGLTILQTLEDIKELIATLGCPINTDYFGL